MWKETTLAGVSAALLIGVIAVTGGADPAPEPAAPELSSPGARIRLVAVAAQDAVPAAPGPTAELAAAPAPEAVRIVGSPAVAFALGPDLAAALDGCREVGLAPGRQAYDLVLAGDADAALVDRDPNENELRLGAVTAAVGTVAIAFGVPEASPVRLISAEHLDAVLAGDHERWDAVGGAEVEIVRWRQPASGSTPARFDSGLLAVVPAHGGMAPRGVRVLAVAGSGPNGVLMRRLWLVTRLDDPRRAATEQRVRESLCAGAVARWLR